MGQVKVQGNGACHRSVNSDSQDPPKRAVRQLGAGRGGREGVHGAHEPGSVRDWKMRWWGSKEGT